MWFFRYRSLMLPRVLRSSEYFCVFATIIFGITVLNDTDSWHRSLEKIVKCQVSMLLRAMVVTLHTVIVCLVVKFNGFWAWY